MRGVRWTRGVPRARCAATASSAPTAVCAQSASLGHSRTIRRVAPLLLRTAAQTAVMSVWWWALRQSAEMGRAARRVLWAPSRMPTAPAVSPALHAARSTTAAPVRVGCVKPARLASSRARIACRVGAARLAPLGREGPVRCVWMARSRTQSRRRASRVRMATRARVGLAAPVRRGASPMSGGLRARGARLGLRAPAARACSVWRGASRT